MTLKRTDGYFKTFPTRLRETIEKNKLTQATVAEKVGVSRQTIGNYCDGSRSPDTETLAKLATALNVSADYLLGIHIDEQPQTCGDLIRTITSLVDTFEGISCHYQPEETDRDYNPQMERYEYYTVQEEAMVVKFAIPGLARYLRELAKLENMMKGASPEVKAYEENIKRDLLNSVSNIPLEEKNSDRDEELPF